MAGSYTRGASRPLLPSLRVALDVGFVALGVALTFTPLGGIPIPPAMVAPGQHMINVLVGILVGPWDAVLVAAAIGIIRNALGRGTVLALAGLFGGLIVGLLYRYVWRSDHVAWFESLGTVVIGGTLGYLLLLPLTEPTVFFGFLTGRPLAREFLGFAGMFALWATFAVSSVPGSALGFLLLKALRGAGLTGFGSGRSQSGRGR